MYNIIQYYSFAGKVCKHLYSTEKTFEDAHSELMNLLKLYMHIIDDANIIIGYGISKENIEYMVLEKGKDVMTIVKEDSIDK